MLKRITDSKRSRVKLHALRGELLRRRDRPVPEQGRWLASVLRGHANYYGVPGNQRALYAFRSEAVRHWFMALRRRSQRTRLTWAADAAPARSMASVPPNHASLARRQL